MAKAIMIQGTASGVGKTMLTLALCRIFKQDGYAVAPFKAQNMTTNTHITAKGEEIAVSQWLQALAAGVEPMPEMNPVILRPSSQESGCAAFSQTGLAVRQGRTSGCSEIETQFPSIEQKEQKATQVILNGKLFDTINAYNFKEIKQKLVPEIAGAYSRLSDKYDIIVIEGAGSPVELNLNKGDIVNMGMAKKANAPVLLVADIDRGGVFASLYGTINLMEETERVLVKATVVNRFRGEPLYFADGVKIIEDITTLPVAGVIPYMSINLPEEDGLFGGSQYPQIADFDSEFDSIADNARKSLDMGLVYKILNDGV